MKKIQALFFFIFCLTSAFTQDLAVLDKVIATVGGEIILLSDLEENFALLEDEKGSLPPGTRCIILDNLLVNSLLLNQAKLDSVEVSEEEVETQLDARFERILSMMNNDISQFEAYYGQTIAEVKEKYREDLKNQLLTERKRNEVLQEVSVTPAEVKDFFHRIPADSLPYFNSEVEFAEIVYKPKVNPEERQRARDKLNEIRTRIVDGGEDFSEMAEKYSDDASARAGGDLGWTQRGDFVAEFEAAAYALEENEISPVIESEFGLHIIQLLQRRGNSINTRHILIKPEITEEDLTKATELLDSVRLMIASDSLSFSRAVKRFSDDKVQSYNNNGRVVNPQTGNTFFEIGDLDPDIFFVQDTMDVGAVSAPIPTTSPIGEKFFRIIILQSRTAPHKANLNQDYSKIQMAALEEKKGRFINDWVAQKINETYFDFDARYDACESLKKWKGEGVKP